MSELENENGDAADSHMRVPENSRNVEINGSRRLWRGAELNNRKIKKEYFCDLTAIIFILCGTFVINDTKLWMGTFFVNEKSFHGSSSF